MPMSVPRGTSCAITRSSSAATKRSRRKKSTSVRQNGFSPPWIRQRAVPSAQTSCGKTPQAFVQVDLGADSIGDSARNGRARNLIWSAVATIFLLRGAAGANGARRRGARMGLELGNVGDDVRRLHGLLARAGFTISSVETAAARFGDETRDALVKLQARLGLSVTGKIDD